MDIYFPTMGFHELCNTEPSQTKEIKEMSKDIFWWKTLEQKWAGSKGFSQELKEARKHLTKQ